MNFFKAWLTGISLIFCLPVFAGHIMKISSKNGVVILKNGEKITGELYFFYKTDLIQIKESNQLNKAFTAHQVDKFRFYDEKFYGFYEVISWGEIEVLGKLKFEDKSHMSIYKNPRLASNKVFVPKLIAHDYYVYHDADFMPLKEFHEQVLSKLYRKDEDLAKYVETEIINVNDVYNQLKIIAHYNQSISNDNYNFQQFIE